MAQYRVITGIVMDERTKEPVPTASVFLIHTGSGTNVDSQGRFSFKVYGLYIADTLEISAVGYKIYKLPFKSATTDSLFYSIKLSVLKNTKDVRLRKVTYDRGLWFWRKVMKRKPFNDTKELDNYGYKTYNKIELDLNNIKKNGFLKKSGIFKPFDFAFSYLDSSKYGTSILPTFLSESLSYYYHEQKPFRTREILLAAKTNGIQNESVLKFLGNTYQDFNPYNDLIGISNSRYMGPFNPNAGSFYKFKLLDTQYLNNKRLLHLNFAPLHKGDILFAGDAWIADTTFAIQRIEITLPQEANINFIEHLSVYKEYQWLNDTIWFPYKDKFSMVLSALTKNGIGVIVTKSAIYSDISINSPIVQKELNKNRKPVEVVISNNLEQVNDSFWTTKRPEQLTKQEQGIYKMLDSIQKNPKFETYRNSARFLFTGYANLWKLQIGPWFNWIGYNASEGYRLRFDLGTNYKFSKKIYLHAYTAYGFRDTKMKGGAEILYLIKKNPRLYIHLWYSNDIDQGQIYYNNFASTSIISLVRKPGVPFKLQRLENRLFEFFKENNKGFQFTVALNQKRVLPILNLPDVTYFGKKPGEFLNNFESSFNIRYAYLETFIEPTNFLRVSLSSKYPITNIKFSKGWSHVLGSNYDYSKLDGNVYYRIPCAPIGNNIYLNIFAGKLWGTVPYPFLPFQPGNENYWFNKATFNLMNQYQYMTDQYAGFHIEHNIGPGLFQLWHVTRRLKFRQFWTARGVWGSISEANKKLNFVGTNYFQNLNNGFYLEVGTGIDNIFKFGRIDFIWKVLPRPLPALWSEKFGVFLFIRVAP
ncbi:MAG: DUF5686 family protein [Phycisphaerales bacterium]|nr:DUF5686 family protein [Phycisphaerales bacterium]